MEQIKIGAITIGQSPRVDITNDIKNMLSPNINLIECGALDSFTYEEICEKYSPSDKCTHLVSRMRDGKQITISEEKILPLIQQCINILQAKNCSAILLLCTHKFPEFKHNIPLIFPSKIINNIVCDLVGKGSIGNVLPSHNQIEENNKIWKEYGIQPISVAASPYDSYSQLENVISKLSDESVKLIYLNCLGYSIEMKNKVKKITNKSVILPRTIIARILNEMYQ